MKIDGWREKILGELNQTGTGLSTGANLNTITNNNS